MPYKDKQKQNAYQNRHNLERRMMWINENGPCRQCGSFQDLQVDHINRLEKVSHRIWSWSKARREEELRKCQALCKECHKKKSISEISKPIQHGTVYGYRRKCRCEECMKAAREASRKFRLKKLASSPAREHPPTRVAAICQECGKAFNPLRKEINRGRGKLCSWACNAKKATRIRTENLRVAQATA